MAGVTARNTTDAVTGASRGRRVLVSTIPPEQGGVPEMTRCITQMLSEKDYEPVLAYYEPYSVTPELSVPSFRLFQRRPGTVRRRAFGRYEAFAVGAWFPELEFTHYLPTRAWRGLMAECDYHISVSGNALAALPFALTATPFLLWVATPWLDDRRDRVQRFPFYRRALDRLVNGNVLRMAERYVLGRGTVLALSEHTRDRLNTLGGKPVHGVLPMPVDAESFKPDPAAVVPGRVGFVGRFDDPRKNAGLLIQAVQRCRARGLDVNAVLIGAEPGAELRRLVADVGLEGAVRFLPYIDHAELPRHLSALDLFVIPSHQEGLCIAALEAMACGCPVISTRCGGPEEFVRDGDTGYLVDDNPDALAAAIAAVVSDRARRASLAQGARALVERRYSPAAARETFWPAFQATFG